MMDGNKEAGEEAESDYKSYGNREELTLTLQTWTIWRAPTNASKWRMGFNSPFKGLTCLG